jgi:hypothetical protein
MEGNHFWTTTNGTTASLRYTFVGDHDRTPDPYYLAFSDFRPTFGVRCVGRK